MATAPKRSLTLVWIDAGQAIVLRWEGGPRIARHTLDVPPHERSVGHVRHDPFRHGGGRAQSGLETHRHEHLRQGLVRVAADIPSDEDVLLIGPGTVRERLASLLRNDDKEAGRVREVRTEPAQRVTEPQLVARLRDLAGEPPARRR